MTTTLRRLTAVVAIAVAVPVAGCGSSSDSSGSSNGDVAKAIPSTASVYIEATVRPSGQTKTDAEAALGKILHTSDPGAKIRELIDQAAKKDGKSYAKDVDPWLGDKAAVGVVGPIMSTAPGSVSAPYIVAIASKDDGKANDLLDSDKDYNGKGSYHGVDYKTSSKDNTAAAVVDGYVLIGGETAFKQAVDAVKGKADSIADNAGFKEGQGKVGGDKLGFLYFDLQSLIAQTAGSNPSVGALKNLLGDLKGYAAGISADASAIRMDVATIGTSNFQGSKATAITLDSAPGDAWLAFATGKVGDTIGKFVDAIKSAPTGQGAGTIGDAINQFETATGLKLQDDVLSWMGDAGFFVKGDSLPALGGGLVVQSTDPAKTKATIAKVKSLLAKLGKTPGPKPDGLDEGFSLPSGSQLGPIQIGLKGQRFVVALGQGALKDALGFGPGTLGSKPTYQAASKLLTTGGKPSFYLDWQTVVKFIEAFGGSNPSFQKAKPYLESFTAIVAGGAGDHGQLAIGLK